MAKGVRKATEPAEDNQLEPQPVKAETASPYSPYDLWRVETKRETKKDQASRQEYTVITEFEAIKVMRKGVKIEKTVADQLNAQSHNNGRRYYPAGTVTNGDIEKVNISTY